MTESFYTYARAQCLTCAGPILAEVELRRDHGQTRIETIIRREEHTCSTHDAERNQHDQALAIATEAIEKRFVENGGNYGWKNASDTQRRAYIDEVRPTVEMVARVALDTYEVDINKPAPSWAKYKD